MIINWVPNNNTPNPIPNYYRHPGIPLYWRDEQSGQLELAIFRYLNYCNKQAETPPTDYQIWLIRCYFEHYINAPVWMDNDEGKLQELKNSIKTIQSVESINAWINNALSIGLDPL